MGTDSLAVDLRDKALLALEDAVQECRYRTPRPSHAVRFALAFLRAQSGKDRAVFDEFWKCYIAKQDVASFSSADRALSEIYVTLGLRRSDEVPMEMWKRWFEREKSDNPA